MDALASAFGLKLLLHQLSNGRIQTRIFIGRQSGLPQIAQAIEMYRLQPHLTYAATATDLPKTVALVDSASTTDTRFPFPQDCETEIALDHHFEVGTTLPQAGFVIIDTENVGSTSTLVAELLKHFRITPTTPEEVIVFTLLALGMYSDAKGIILKPRDTAAFMHALSHDPNQHNELFRLINYTLPVTYFERLAALVSGLQTLGVWKVGYLGILRPQEMCLVFLFADELIRQAETKHLLLAGSTEQGILRVSARSNDQSFNLHHALTSSFGADRAAAKLSPTGRLEGGANLPLPQGLDPHNINAVQNWLAELVAGKA